MKANRRRRFPSVRSARHHDTDIQSWSLIYKKRKNVGYHIDTYWKLEALARNAPHDTLRFLRYRKRLEQIAHRIYDFRFSLDSRSSQSLKSIAAVLENSYELSGNLNQLNLAIDMQQQAIENAHDADQFLPLYQAVLANMLSKKFEKTDSAEDVHNAFKVVIDPLKSVAKDHPYRFYLLDGLLILLGRLRVSTFLKDTTDNVDCYIAYTEQALGIKPMDSYYRITFWIF